MIAERSSVPKRVSAGEVPVKAKPVRCLVVGAGSVGSRHIRNLVSLGAAVSVFAYRKNRVDEIRSLGTEIDIVPSLDDALGEMPDAVVIANRTDQHIGVALAAARRGLNLFIEKPLSHSMAGLAELNELIKKQDLVVEVGCMMRFHPNLSAIKRMLDEEVIGRPYFARAVVGQYLPEWRPGTDYQQSYSAHREQGGGVVLDLVHELDLLVWWFGPVEEVAAMLGFDSELKITAESVAQIGLRFGSGLLAQIHMDYLRPAYHRSIEIVGSKGQLTWEDGKGVVTLTTQSQRQQTVSVIPQDFQRNDLFLSHMSHFLKRLQDKTLPEAVPFDDGLRVEQVALSAHRSAADRSFVRPDALSWSNSVAES